MLDAERHRARPPTGWRGCAPAATIIWPSPTRSPRCWRGWKLWRVGPTGRSGWRCCTSATLYFPTTGQYTYYSPQYSSLYAWRSMANANYNAMQVSLRHRMVNGFQFDLNYTFSKSIDLASDAETYRPRQLYQQPQQHRHQRLGSQPERGVSSYDATHQFNANWLVELPFGRGHAVGRDSNRFVDAFIGGWQVSGLFRWTSGFPVNVDNGYSNFPTNFEQEGNADLVAPVKTGAFFNTGTPNIFANGPAALSSFAPAYAGESGQRNVIRGNGFFGIDLGVSKRWTMPWSESQSLQFRWETFNVTNSVRFDVQSSLLSSALTLGSGGSFGNYSGLLTNPRIMQFALRFEFSDAVCSSPKLQSRPKTGRFLVE